MSQFSISIGPRVRQSPYFEATVAAGVTSFSVYNHMYMPISFGSPEAEYDRLINGVVMWDVAAQRQVEIVGSDAGDLVDLLSARDLSNVSIGQAKYMPMCDHQGRLINDPLVLRVDEDRWWVSIADGDMLQWCRAIAFERGFRSSVEEPDVSPMAVQGPLAEDVVAALLGDGVRSIRFFNYMPYEIDGIPLWVGRAGWSKQGGFEIYLCDHTRGTDLWRLVAGAGEPFGIIPAAPNYIERVESALLSFRADNEFDTDPFELGLGRWVDLDGRDFIGRDALAERKAAGPRRRLVGVVINGEPITGNDQPWPVWAQGHEIGTVRAAAFSPRLGQNIGMALIDSERADPDNLVEIATDEGRRGATTCSLPFI
jgi:aminomethyltransferase